MSAKNDNRVLALKEKIKVKKQAMDKQKQKSYQYLTNLSLEFDGNRYNLHTLQKHKVIDLLVRLQSLHITAESLGLVEEYQIGGFLVKDWTTDLCTKLQQLNYKEELKELDRLESKLEELLSSEKQVELQLDSIEELLKK